MISGRISGIIVAERDGSSRVDFWAGDLGIKQLPKLPQEICGSSMVVHNGTIILCGGWGNTNKCLKLHQGTWKKHSRFNKKRALHSVVTTPTATFVFGGGFSNSKTYYEYLPKNSTKWLMGKTEIPGGFVAGCAIAVKFDQEIWLIGGWTTEKRILCFNVESHTFQVLPFQLNVGRDGHRCALIPNTTDKVMITGGYGNTGQLDSVEILDTVDGSVTMAMKMVSKRYHHGMGVVTINGKDSLVVFGGADERNNVDSVELYNTLTGKWEKTDFKLNEAKSHFSFLTLKLKDIISNLQLSR